MKSKTNRPPGSSAAWTRRKNVPTPFGTYVMIFPGASVERTVERQVVGQGEPSGECRRLVIGAPGSADGLAEIANRLLDRPFSAAQLRGRCCRQLLVHDDRAGDAVRPQGIFDHRSEQPPFAGMRADVWIGNLPRIDHAADDEPGHAEAILSGVSHERGDRTRRAPTDDPDAPVDLACIVLLLAEAVMVRLPGLGNLGIAELHHPPRQRDRRLPRPGEHDSNGIARFDAESQARHRMSSFTSSYDSVRSAKPNVPEVLSSFAMSRTSARLARIGPDPTLTRATPNASSSEIGGVPLTARMLIGPPMP